MRPPAVAPHKVAADLRLLFPDLVRPGSVLRTRSASTAEDAPGDASAVASRVETGLARMADVYRATLLLGVALIVVPPGLAVVLFRMWFGSALWFEPFARDFYWRGVSLYEAMSWTLVAVAGVVLVILARRGRGIAASLALDYRRFADADEPARVAFAYEAASGAWPRTRALLGRARPFSAYRTLLAAAERQAAEEDAARAEPAAESLPPVHGGPGGRPPLAVRHGGLLGAAAFVAASLALTTAGGVVAGRILASPIDRDLAGILGGLALSGSYVVVLALGAWMAVRSGVPLSEAFGLRPVPVGRTIAIAIAVGAGARVVAYAWAIAVERFGIRLGGDEIDPSTLLPGVGGAALLLLATCVLAPLAEELVFRGVLLSAIAERTGVAWAIVFSSLVFTGVHLLPFTFPPIFVLSLALGIAFSRSRSLWTPIAIHAAFNTIGLVGVFALRAAGLA